MACKLFLEKMVTKLKMLSAIHRVTYFSLGFVKNISSGSTWKPLCSVLKYHVLKWSVSIVPSEFHVCLSAIKISCYGN